MTDSAIKATGAERSGSLTGILAEAERRLLVERACLIPAEVLALQALSDERLGDLADLVAASFSLDHESLQDPKGP